MKRTALALLILLSGLLVWGVVIEPRLFAVNRYEVGIPGLPPAWRGKEIGFIADLQVGMFLGNEGTVRRMVDRLVRTRPAVVLIGGDFIYHPTEDEEKAEAREEFEAEDKARARSLIEQAVGLVRPLAKNGIPTYAVLGNHDYAMQTRESLKLEWLAGELEQALSEAGIRVLRNEAVAMQPPASATRRAGGPLYLLGIGPDYPGEADVKKALAGLPAGTPRIVMTHNPQTCGRIPAGAAPLAIAAHTHGGQVRIPFLDSWSWLSIVREGEVHADGWISGFGAPGNRLYVNRGIGFSRVPIRINCRPELTFFILRD